MYILDLLKATIICGLLAFVVYSVPEVGAGLTIALLTLLWLSYAHRTIIRLLRRELKALRP